jgi:hypothetical protein
LAPHLATNIASFFHVQIVKLAPLHPTPLTGGMQRGLFQNKPALLVYGLFATCAWLLDDDKI